MKKAFLVHGEENQSGPMSERIKEKFGIESIIMKPGETVEL